MEVGIKDVKEFIAGFRRFQGNYFHGDNELFSQLKKGQQPAVKSERLQTRACEQAAIRSR